MSTKKQKSGLFTPPVILTLRIAVPAKEYYSIQDRTAFLTDVKRFGHEVALRDWGIKPEGPVTLQFQHEGFLI